MKKYIILKCGFIGFLLGIIIGMEGLFGLFSGISHALFGLFPEMLHSLFYYVGLWWFMDTLPLGEGGIIIAPLILIGIWTLLGMSVGFFITRKG